MSTLTETLTELFAVFPAARTPERIRAYAYHLRELDPEVAIYAVRETIKTWTKTSTPPPAVILDNAKSEHTRLRDAAVVQQRQDAIDYKNAIPFDVKKVTFARAIELRKAWAPLCWGIADTFTPYVLGLFSWTVAAHELGYRGWFPNPGDSEKPGCQPYRILEGELIDAGLLGKDWRIADA